MFLLISPTWLRYCISYYQFTITQYALLLYQNRIHREARSKNNAITYSRVRTLTLVKRCSIKPCARRDDAAPAIRCGQVVVSLNGRIPSRHWWRETLYTPLNKAVPKMELKLLCTPGAGAFERTCRRLRVENVERHWSCAVLCIFQVPRYIERINGINCVGGGIF